MLWFPLFFVATVVSAGGSDRPEMVQQALAANKPLYYFGLGSNMSRSKLLTRTSSQIRIRKMEAAVVPNYRLAFNMRGFFPLEPGMGSLEPVNESEALLTYQKGECHGALIELSAKDYELVMKSEGVGQGSRGYEEIIVTAIPYNKRKRPVQAVALRARRHVRLKRDPCPSLRYMEILRQGAKELGLKACYQEFLSNHPVQSLSQLLKKIAIANLVWTTTVSFRFKLRFVSKLQNQLLYLLHVPPTAPVLLRILSEVLTALILLPGSIPGYLIIASGKISPFMKQMVDRYWQ